MASESGANNADETSSRLHFGAGCITFLVPGIDKRSDRQDERWREAVSGALESIAAASDVIVNIRDVSQWETHPRDILNVSEFTDVDNILQPRHGAVVLNLHIPRRIQAQLLSTEQPRLQTEEFSLVTIYGWHGPASFVTCPNLKSTQPDGSQAVIVVREFLIRELANLNNPIELVITGPSRFHADMIIEWEDRAGLPGFTMDIDRRQAGYDVITFHINKTGAVIDFGQYMPKVFENIIRELQLFYFLERAATRSSHRAHIIDILTNKLVELHSRQGIRGVIARAFRSGHLSRELQLDIINAEHIERYEKNSASDALERLSHANEVAQFGHYLEKVANVTSIKEFESARRVGELLEGGRKKEFEVVVISLSTMLGALAGAVAALIAK